MTIDTETPQQVVRFYGTVDYAIDVIKNRQIAFAHVSTLNDPFDPYYFFETDFGDSYQNLIAHVRRNHPDPSRLQLTFRRNQRFAQCMDFRFHLACIRYSASDLLAQDRCVLLAQAVNQRFGSAKVNAHLASKSCSAVSVLSTGSCL